MTDEQRAARVAELQELRRCDAPGLILIYRRAVGLDVLAPLPAKLTLPDMIRAIVEKEARVAR